MTAFGPAALAATHINVEQLEHMLAGERNHPDAKVAKKLSNLELTERATSARLTRWETDFPGKQTHEALLALADASAFLNLPAADIPSLPTPDAATQKQILSRAIDYVKSTTHKLPNFLARRTTTRFDDGPNMLIEIISDGPQDNKPRPFRTDSSTESTVTYLNGLEVQDASADDPIETQSLTTGLTTSGEFGPILTTVAGDATHGQVFWSHWEQGPTGPRAVLRYSIPQEQSHYAVSLGTAMESGKAQFPAYHGEIAVDPTTGAILRVTMEAELHPSHQIFKSSVLVEYGPVPIAGRNYTCPVRGVALSTIYRFSAEDKPDRKAIPFVTYLNDVSFTHYHVFRADVRIVP